MAILLPANLYSRTFGTLCAVSMLPSCFHLLTVYLKVNQCVLEKHTFKKEDLNMTFDFHCYMKCKSFH